VRKALAERGTDAGTSTGDCHDLACYEHVIRQVSLACP